MLNVRAGMAVVLLNGAFALGLSPAVPADGSTFSIRNRSLRVALAVPFGLLTVDDLRNGVVWRQYVPFQSARGRAWGQVDTTPIPPDRLIRLADATVDGTTIRAKATWKGYPFEVTYRLAEDEPRLTVTLDTPKRYQRLPWQPGWAGVILMTYPYAFVNDEAGPEVAVPIDEGVLWSIRETDPKVDYRRWNSYWLHQRLSMPWWGVTDGRRGVMTEVETPFDCLFSVNWVRTASGERTLPHITWLDSKRTWAYPRRVTFRFFTEGGYVAMAKAFRRAEQARGAFRSWQDKLRANPEVARLRGALDVWNQTDLTAELVEALQASGVRRAIVAKPRAGDAPEAAGIHPDAAHAARRAGYLIGGYHNFSWIQGRWVDANPSLKEAAVLPESGQLKYKPNAWDPKGRLDRCPATHRTVFVQRGRQARRLGLNYFFTDCTTTGGSIQECYNPDHPVRRSEGADRLNEGLQSLANLGLIVGSERGKWWATRTTHVFEGVETLLEYAGPYYGSGDQTHWVGPYREDKPGYRERFLGYDFNPARRVPLFQLVYHDSVFCTRRWNQDPGRAPELWNRHDLFNILYGTPTILFLHPKAGNVIGTSAWAKVKDRYCQTYQNVCGWHEKIGFDEMTNHRFLSADRLVQETRFSSGWAVVVNFSKVAWRDPRGFTVEPEGFRTFRNER